MWDDVNFTSAAANHFLIYVEKLSRGGGTFHGCFRPAGSFGISMEMEAKHNKVAQLFFQRDFFAGAGGRGGLSPGSTLVRQQSRIYFCHQDTT